MDVLNDIIKVINDSKKIAILYHINGDGDAVGSSLALYLGFKDDKEIDIFADENVAHNLKFLPSSDIIKYNHIPEDVYDLAIAVDCGDKKRMGSREKVFDAAKFRINIDHHNSNDIVGEINLIDEKSPATGEIVHKILEAGNIEITKEIAECLYVAILTDTGSFKHSSTTPSIHRIVAELMEVGISTSEIFRNVYENVSYERQKLLGRILNGMELLRNGKLTIMSTDYNEINEIGARQEDLENVANYGIGIIGVELSIFIKEAEPGICRISLRSKRNFDCASFAKSLGGGGHMRAAGCDVKGTKEEVKGILVEKLKGFEL